jgi:hypothetical protein
MSDDPRRSSRRRRPIQVEPLETRSLLSVSAFATRVSQVQAQVVVDPSSIYVNQQQGSFSVTLSLKQVKGHISSVDTSNPLAGLTLFPGGPDATLNVPLTVDFTASLAPFPYESAQPSNSMFAPFHTSVTFPPGVSTETVAVPIISSTAASDPAMLQLRATPTSSSVVAAGGGTAELFSSSDAAPPRIASVQLETQGKLASAVVLGFSKPMAPATVENLTNYRILSRPTVTTRHGFLFSGGSITTNIQSFPIAAANYDPSTSTVTLTLQQPVNASRLYEVASAYPVQGHELTDQKSQPLAQSLSLFPYQFGAQFTLLVHPKPGVAPTQVGRLHYTIRTDSPVSNLNPMKGFS